jgi:hypothetical protein
VVQYIVLGDPSEVMKPLGLYSEGSINTAFLERLNLTICYSLVRFVRGDGLGQDSDDILSRFGLLPDNIGLFGSN